MPAQTRSRKQGQQTRLTFTPLSSSPATRHANVRYESPGKAIRPSKSARDALLGANGREVYPAWSNPALLTPEVSSPIEVKEVAKGPQTSSQALPTNRGKDLESDDEDDDDIVAFASSRRRLYSSPSREPEGDETIQPLPIMRKTTGRSKEMAVEGPATPRRSGRLTTREKDLRRSSTHSTISVEIISPPKGRENESSKATRDRNHGSPSSSGLKRIPATRSVLDMRDSDLSDDDSDFIATRPTQRRQRQTSTRERDTFVVDDDDIEYNSTSESSNHRRSSGRSKARDTIKSSDVQSESESDAVLTTPAKRKRGPPNLSSKKTPRSARYKNRQEAQEIAEDLEDLRSSSPMSGTRARERAVNTTRARQQKLLDRLKRKRAGAMFTGSEQDQDNEDPEDDQQNRDDTLILENGSSPIEIQSDSDVSSSNASKSVPHVQPSDQQDLDADDEDFIVSDPEEDILGVPTASLPFQFSHHASARPREHFKYVIEWFVKNKIAPAFRRHDDIYDTAFKKVNDEVQGQAGSRYRSAAWNREFLTVLDARPVFHIQEYDGSEVLHPVCDACKRTNHPATWEISFTGEPYDKDTMEPIDGEDEDADEDNGVEYDIKGNPLPPQTTQYYLGRFCAFNAEMTHKLSHWKWHLNDWLLDFLESQDVLSTDAIVARDKLSQKKRESEAEIIVDGMEQNGEMDRLWRDFKTDKERAREGMEDTGGRQSTLLRGKIKGRSGGGLNMFTQA